MTIVPRWEWRTFGERFEAVEETFATLTPELAEESDETYLLSTLSDASVKIRGGLMDVKHLDTVNDDGLEQWHPVLKGEFPLAAADVAAVLAELGLPAVPLDRDAYTLDQLIGEVASHHPELQAVGVHKQRTHFIVGGAMTELSELTVNDRVTGTIVVELDDPGLVIAAVRELGLADRPNVCMARGLKALVGLG
jgi:exopolyphosphatase / guanosine-5'-triphosphate,3'-diphosphate pyrophosphatase